MFSLASKNIVHSSPCKRRIGIPIIEGASRSLSSHGGACSRRMMIPPRYALGQQTMTRHPPSRCLWFPFRRLTTMSPKGRFGHRSQRAIGASCRKARGDKIHRCQTTSTTKTIPEPSMHNLRLVALGQAIPFIGFGFMDNSILIIAGDMIDTSMGIWLGISTLCAAAIGNIISDLAGIAMGGVIEDFCANVLRLPVPDITSAQRQLRSVRMASNLGMAAGMTLGCIIGMVPLLWLDATKVEHLKKKAHLESLFRDVVSEAKTLIGAESTCLYLRVHLDEGGNSGSDHFSYSISPNQYVRPAVDGNYLYAMHHHWPEQENSMQSSIANSETSSERPALTNAPVAPGKGDDFLPLGKGIVSRAILTGEAWNIDDVRSEPDFMYRLPDGSIPSHFRQFVAVPVLDGQGRAIAVIRAFNKIPNSATESGGSKASSNTTPGFTHSDVQVLKSLASHISVNLQTLFRDEEDDEMRLRDTIRILKEHGVEGISNTSSKMLPRRPSLFPAESATQQAE